MLSVELWKTKIPKAAQFLLVFMLAIGWVFAGWPQIFNFPPKIQVVQAATATKTWSFAADLESWTASTPAPNNTVAQWQSADGSPANGSLEMRITGKNKTNNGRIWEIAGTWEAIFGIPVGSTVTEVGSGTGNSYNYRVSEYNVGAAGNSGPFEFYDNTPTLQGAFSAATAFSGLVAWTAKTGAAVSVPAGLQASNNTVRFRITNNLATGNNNGAAVTLRQDQIVLTITYTTNSAPNAPSQDSPANSATGVSVTPTFLMTATDPNSDKLGYKVTIYSENTCTTVEQTNDQAVSATGWTGSDATCTAAPTACYLSGTQGSFLTQTALSNSTQYWWKASAKDPDGNGTFTNSSTCNTFTTVAAPSLTFVVTTDNFPNITPGSPVFATSTLSVNTDNAAGWIVTLSGDRKNSGSTTMAALDDQSFEIPDPTAVWSVASGVATTTAANAVSITSGDDFLYFRVMSASGTIPFRSTAWWGTSDVMFNGSQLWAGIASSTNVSRIGKSSVSSGGAPALNTVQYYLDVPATQRTGTYSGGLTFTATMN